MASSLKIPMQDGRLQGIETIVQRQPRMTPKCDDRGLFGFGQDRRTRFFRAVFISSTAARFRHLATVLGLMPGSMISAQSEACDHSGRPSDRWRISPHYCSFDGVRGRGDSVANLSRNASGHF
jgi:hypothetical protein